MSEESVERDHHAGTVELDAETVDGVLEVLEDGMQSGETYHSHEEVRPSGLHMAKAVKDAYQALVVAHPDYELVEGNDE